LVLTYDLLENRRIDDVIIADIFPDWAKENVEKSLVKAVNRYEKQEEERKTRFFQENDSEK